MLALHTLRSELRVRLALFALVTVAVIVAMGIDRGFRAMPQTAPFPPLPPDWLIDTDRLVQVCLPRAAKGQVPDWCNLSLKEISNHHLSHHRR